jgi:hypothetical protein
MRMIRILVLDFLVVCIVIYRKSLIIKNGPGSANYIILLSKLKKKYSNDDNNRLRYNTGRSFPQCSELDKPKARVAKPPATPPATTPTFEVSNVSSVQSQQ